MASPESVTDWVKQVQTGDPLAAQKLWERYDSRLVQLCRTKLASRFRQSADEEDMVTSAFDSFYRGAKQGRFPRIDDRHDLWQLLVSISKCKVIDHVKRETALKRGGGNVYGESAFGAQGSSEDERPLDQVVGRDPTPDDAALVVEQCERLLMKLGDETLCNIAQHKLEGYTNQEIADRLGMRLRTVERKLARIRAEWSSEAQSDG